MSKSLKRKADIYLEDKEYINVEFYREGYSYSIIINGDVTIDLCGADVRVFKDIDERDKYEEIMEGLRKSIEGIKLINNGVQQ